LPASLNSGSPGNSELPPEKHGIQQSVYSAECGLDLQSSVKDMNRYNQVVGQMNKAYRE
jgi:hypothetical protein